MNRGICTAWLICLLAAVVGLVACSDDESSSGSSDATLTGLTQQAYLKAPTTDVNDQFGFNGVSLSGDTIVVGTANEAECGTMILDSGTPANLNACGGAGAAHVYVRSGSIWGRKSYLKPANTDTGDFFGVNAAVSGDTIVVGAGLEAACDTGVTNGTTASSDNNCNFAGAVYVIQ